MKGLFTIVLLAVSCAQRTDVAPIAEGHDAGGVITLTPSDRTLVVVRGSTVTALVTVESFPTVGSKEVLVGFGPLPLGVIGTQATWHMGEASVTLAITAASDAPEAEIPIEIRAIIDGTIRANAALELEVSDVIGSMDTSFGNGGFVLLPAALIEPRAIGCKDDGSFVIAGMDAQKHVFVQHMSADGTFGTFGHYGPLMNLRALAISHDGRVAAAGVEASNPDEVVEFNDAAQFTKLIENLPLATALAWDGDALFVGSYQQLIYEPPSGAGVTITTPVSVASLETIAPGRVLLGGVYGSSPTLVTYDATAAQISLVSNVSMSPHVQYLTNTITYANGLTLVGIVSDDGSVARVDANGNVLAMYSSTANWTSSFAVGLPNGEPLLAGTGYGAGTKNKGDFAGMIERFDGMFGTLGHTLVRVGGPSSIASAVVDATGEHLYVTGKVLSDAQHGYVARIRVK